MIAAHKNLSRPALDTLTAHSTTHTNDSTPEGDVTQRRRLPPYGRKLRAMRDQGQAPVCAVLIVDGWGPVTMLDEYAPWVLIVPDDEPAARFDFMVIAGLFVYIIADTAERADEIAAHVWHFEPRMVYSWTADTDTFTFHARRIN